MDGINGITGGYSLVVLGSLAFINHWVVSFVEPGLIYTMLCAVLVLISLISVRGQNALPVMWGRSVLLLLFCFNR